MTPPSGNSLPPATPSHPSRLSQSTGLSFLGHTANSIYFTHASVLLSQSVSLSLSLTMSTSLFFMSLTVLLSYK